MVPLREDGPRGRDTAAVPDLVHDRQRLLDVVFRHAHSRGTVRYVRALRLQVFSHVFMCVHMALCLFLCVCEFLFAPSFCQQQPRLRHRTALLPSPQEERVLRRACVSAACGSRCSLSCFRDLRGSRGWGTRLVGAGQRSVNF